MSKTIVAQDNLIRQLEDSVGARKNVIDIKLYIGRDTDEIPDVETTQYTATAFSECFAQPLRRFETEIKGEIDRKRKKIEIEDRQPIKRFIKSTKGKEKGVDYQETDEEIRRKRDLELKVAMGKKDKKKLEFI